MKNKMAEKLLTVDSFSPVIYSHQKPKSDNKTKTFWDQDSNVVFSIVDEKDKKRYKENVSFSEVLFAGEGYPAVIYILPMSIEKFLNINFSDLVKEVWGEEEFAQDKVHKEKISEDFEDIKKWELEVNIVGGYGYHNVFADEKNKVINEMNSFVEKISIKLGERLIESFFNYDDSTVLDLSVVNDVVCFKWDVEPNRFIIKPKEIMNIFETF